MPSDIQHVIPDKEDAETDKEAEDAETDKDDAETDKEDAADMLAFVLELKEFPVLLDKSQVPAKKQAKNKAVDAFINLWQRRYAYTFSKKSLMKKINNMKTRLKEKTDINRTGNKKIKLVKWEEEFARLLKAEENPVFSKIRVSQVRFSAIDLYVFFN